jgi:hypothetical protein
MFDGGDYYTATEKTIMRILLHFLVFEFSYSSFGLIDSLYHTDVMKENSNVRKGGREDRLKKMNHESRIYRSMNENFYKTINQSYEFLCHIDVS